MANILKTNIPGLEKNMDTGIIINTDTTALEAYRKQKQGVLNRKRLEEEVKQLRKDVDGLKEYIQKYSMGCVTNDPKWWIKGFAGCPICDKPSDKTGKYNPYCGSDHSTEGRLKYERENPPK